MNTKNILVIVLILFLLAGICYTSYGIIKNSEPVKKPIATIEIRDYGTIKVELDPTVAPEAVANFVSLANNGFYDGRTFYRTIPDFMIQAGDTGESTSTEIDYTIKGEFAANMVKNNLKFNKGVIGVARADYSNTSAYQFPPPESYSYNSGNSQFFITSADSPHLDGYYTSFGTVLEGLDVVDKIANVEVVTRDTEAEDGLDKPVNPPVITSVRVDTFGLNYGEPEKLAPFNYNDWFYQQYGMDYNQLFGSDSSGLEVNANGEE